MSNFAYVSARHRPQFLSKCGAIVAKLEESRQSRVEGQIKAVALLPARRSGRIKRPKTDSQSSQSQSQDQVREAQEHEEENASFARAAAAISASRRGDSDLLARQRLQRLLSEKVAAVGTVKWLETRKKAGKMGALKAAVSFFVARLPARRSADAKVDSPEVDYAHHPVLNAIEEDGPLPGELLLTRPLPWMVSGSLQQNSPVLAPRHNHFDLPRPFWDDDDDDLSEDDDDFDDGDDGWLGDDFDGFGVYDYDASNYHGVSYDDDDSSDEELEHETSPLSCPFELHAATHGDLWEARVPHSAQLPEHFNSRLHYNVPEPHPGPDNMDHVWDDSGASNNDLDDCDIEFGNGSDASALLWHDLEFAEPHYDIPFAHPKFDAEDERMEDDDLDDEEVDGDEDMAVENSLRWIQKLNHRMGPVPTPSSYDGSAAAITIDQPPTTLYEVDGEESDIDDDLESVVDDVKMELISHDLDDPSADIVCLEASYRFVEDAGHATAGLVYDEFEHHQVVMGSQSVDHCSLSSTGSRFICEFVDRPEFDGEDQDEGSAQDERMGPDENDMEMVLDAHSLEHDDRLELGYYRQLDDYLDLVDWEDGSGVDKGAQRFVAHDWADEPADQLDEFDNLSLGDGSPLFDHQHDDQYDEQYDDQYFEQYDGQVEDQDNTRAIARMTTHTTAYSTTRCWAVTRTCWRRRDCSTATSTATAGTSYQWPTLTTQPT